MIIQELLNEGRKMLLPIAGDDAFLESLLLLSHTLETSREYLVAHIEETVSEAIAGQYRDFLARRFQGEPIAYITGQKEFYGLDFIVNNQVLIPRPETEMLIEEVLKWAEKNDGQNILFIDVGTGSGAIGLTVAKNIPDTVVLALDISRDALAVAQKNKEALGIENVVLLESDILGNLPDIRQEYIVIMANLPYISPDEYTAIDKTVRDYEPFGALVSLDDGLGLYKRLFTEAVKKLKNKGMMMFLECDPRQVKKLKEMARYTFHEPNIRVVKDLSGKERVVVIEVGSGEKIESRRKK